MSSLPLISGLRVAQCLVFCVLEIIVCLFSCGHFIDATDDTVAIFKLVLLKRRTVKQNDHHLIRKSGMVTNICK
jgi:hypothetical protein